MDNCTCRPTDFIMDQLLFPAVCPSIFPGLRPFTSGDPFPADKTLNQCWFNVGPASATLDQSWTNIDTTSCVYNVLLILACHFQLPSTPPRPTSSSSVLWYRDSNHAEIIVASTLFTCDILHTKIAYVSLLWFYITRSLDKCGKYKHILFVASPLFKCFILHTKIAYARLLSFYQCLYY